MVNIGIKRLRHLRQKPTLSESNRVHFRDEQWQGARKKFAIQATAGSIALMLLFLACLCYLYGTLYKSHDRYHKMHVLAVDYDGGLIGKSLNAAYQQMKGPDFPSLYFRTPKDYPTPDDVYQSVRKGHYWGAIYTNTGASQRLSAAIQGGPAASTYLANQSMTWIWNQQPYTTFSQSVIQASLQQLVIATGKAYAKINGTAAFSSVNPTSPAAIQAFLNPIDATSRNIKATPQGSVILFQSVSQAMPILQQFFFLLVLNGISRTHQIYSRMTIRASLTLRRIAGLLFTLGAALCNIAYFWAFRDGWQQSGSQFVLSWMVIWLLMQIHLLYLDVIAAVAPFAVMPFVLLAWIFLNISTTISPLELQPGFYHWGICLPTHNAYETLVTIWTGGASNRLYRNLPILFSWWVVGILLSGAAHVRACHLAYKMERQEAMEEKQPEVAAKDEEEGVQGSIREPQRVPAERQSSESTLGPQLSRRRTVGEVEEENREQRQIYGPSVPPLVD